MKIWKNFNSLMSLKPIPVLHKDMLLAYRLLPLHLQAEYPLLHHLKTATIITVVPPALHVVG